MRLFKYFGLAFVLGSVALGQDVPVPKPKPKATAPATKPEPARTADASATLLVTCSSTCDWSVDGEGQTRLGADIAAKLKVPLGQHLITARAVEGGQRFSKTVEVNASRQYIVGVEFAAAAPTVTTSPVGRATLLVLTDVGVDWKLDGKVRGRLAAGGTESVAVELGTHIVEAVTSDGSDKVNQLVEVTKPQQTLVRLDVASVRAARLQAASLVWVDGTTGLMWTRKDNGGDVTWEEATSYCRGLGVGGHKDWRLGEIGELEGLYDRGASRDFTYDGKTYQYHVKGGIEFSIPFIWSATRNGSGEAWGFYFDTGKRFSDPLDDSSSSRALCVRRSGE